MPAPSVLTMDHQNVLVTGGAGFIGRHLVSALATDNDVHILDSASAGDLPTGISYQQGDVRNLGSVEGLAKEKDIIFHLAAVVDVAESIADPRRAHEINDVGTINVLEAARKHDCRVVLASSAAVYGEPSTIPIHETDSLHPTSPYGLQKLTADHAARLYGELYGLHCVALRYFNVYGPGQNNGHYAGVIETFLSRASAEKPIQIYGDGQQTRDFIHVADIVRANIRAATIDRTARSYNVGTGNAVTIAELATKIRTHCRSNSPIVYADRRAGDIRHSRADTQRAQEELGFEAKIDLDDGLKSLVENSTPKAGKK